MKNVFDMLRLDGKVAVVTGARQGLGFDMAAALAEAGATIVITSRDTDGADETAKKITELYGVKSYAVTIDQTDYDSVEKGIDQIIENEGKIDILINNAGGGSGKSTGYIIDRDPDVIKSLIDTNLTGMIFCCKAVSKYMIEQKSGKIINIGSIAGIVGRNRQMYYKSNKMQQPIDYAASKGGVISATRDLAGLLSPSGICVNSISPGGFYRGEPQAFVDLYSEETPLGRMGTMGKDIKGATLLLASEAGDYITGQNIVVDGGFSIWK